MTTRSALFTLAVVAVAASGTPGACRKDGPPGPSSGHEVTAPAAGVAASGAAPAEPGASAAGGAQRPIGPPSVLPGAEANRPQPVVFATADGVEIHASFWKASDPAAPTVVFAHQARSDGSEWDPFIREMRVRAPGVSLLAIDLRGHGRSTRAGDRAVAWRQFQAGDAPGLQRWSGCTTDVQAAIAFLRSRGEGTLPRSIGLVGSSIGATSAIRAAAADGIEGPGRIAAVVAISPGMNYFSVPIRPALETLTARKHPLLAIAARDDPNDCVGAVVQMQGIMGDLLRVHLVEQGGHGAAMARSAPEVVTLVVERLRAALGG